MTGAEHYDEAERFIDLAERAIDVDTTGFYVAAQVHATLALAAAALWTEGNA